MVRRLRRRLQGTYDRSRPHSAERCDDMIYNENPTIEKLVFIAGLHRSGTTLLERTLVARYDLSCLRASVPESEGQHMQSVFPIARLHGGPGRFAFSADMRAALSDITSLEDCRARILADWSDFVVGGSPVLLEKSPPNLTKIAWLRKVFPGCRFIIMTRDPRAVAAATQKWTGTSLPELMMHWNVAYSLAIEEFREEDCCIIRYEDLCSDLEMELTRIAKLLELTPRSEVQKLEARHNELFNSNSKYLKMHGGTRYGRGVWENFGYKV